MIHDHAADLVPVDDLFVLANTSPDAKAFWAVCEKFSIFDPAGSDSCYWRFKITDGLSMVIGVGAGGPEPSAPRISCAILSFCWWDCLATVGHQTSDKSEAERQQFDSIYSESLRETCRRLGEPLTCGVDDDRLACKHAIWRGRTCLFILQQSCIRPPIRSRHKLLDSALVWPGSTP